MGTRTQDILRRERMESTIPALIDLFAATKQSEGKSKSTVLWYRKRLAGLSGGDITESCGLADRKKAAYPGIADLKTPVGSRRKDTLCSS
jgi:hypothetical protein